MNKRILLCISMSTCTTQIMPMATVKSFFTKHTPIYQQLLSTIKKAPQAALQTARNHKILSTAAVLAAITYAIPQAHKAVKRRIISFNNNIHSCITHIRQGNLLDNLLLDAAFKGYTNIVKILLKLGAHVNTQSLIQETPLHLAARYGHQETARILLDNHAHIDLQIADGRTPLYYAVRENHQEVVRMLINAGANINLQNDAGMTPLFLAAMYGHQEITRMFIDAHAQVDLRDHEGNTPLQWAVRGNHQEVVRMLLNAHAQVDLPDDEGRNPLSWAIRGNHQEVVRMLIDAHARVNLPDNDGITPLHYATFANNQNMIRMLIDAGANINLQNRHGDTPLHWATKWADKNVFTILMSAGANIAIENFGHQTPTYLDPINSAHNEQIKSYLSTIPQLTENLQSAVAQANLNAIKALLAQGAPIATPDQDGNTLIHRVIREYNPQEPSMHDQIARILIRNAPYQASHAQNNKGQTPLHIAAINNNLRIARYLLTHRAEAIAQDILGNTPLHYAQSREMRDLLLRNRADVTIMNQDGQVPLAYNPTLWESIFYSQAQ